jgi:carboxyl-terminal processing protease
MHICGFANASPPIDEIREIVGRIALQAPSSDALSRLDADNPEKGLREIDPYARYLPPPLSRGGAKRSPLFLGIEVFPYGSRLWMRTDPGGPAARAGLPETSQLLAIDRESVGANGFERIAGQLDRAMERKRVALTISRRPGDKGKTYSVRPGCFSAPSFTWRREKKSFIIRIREFAAHETVPGIVALYKTVIRSGAKVIIDLRGCPGGDMYESIELAGRYTPARQPLVTTRNRDGMVESYFAPGGSKLPRPLCLLLDRRSASAAEVFAGILQFHRLTPLVGESSFGKCVSQTLVPLSDGGWLWLTNLAVYFPNMDSCTGKGLLPGLPYPDIAVEDTDVIVKNIKKRLLAPTRTGAAPGVTHSARALRGRPPEVPVHAP